MTTTTTTQKVTATELRPLDLGRDVGITYGFVDPPDPDQPQWLELVYSPIRDLRRASDYADVAGGRTVRVTVDPQAADPPGEADADPPGEADADPPGEADADPPGELDTRDPSVDPPDPDFEMVVFDRAGHAATSVAVDPPDPDVDPPDPDHVHLRVQLVGAATVDVYDASGKFIGSLAAR